MFGRARQGVYSLLSPGFPDVVGRNHCPRGFLSVGGGRPESTVLILGARTAGEREPGQSLTAAALSVFVRVFGVFPGEPSVSGPRHRPAGQFIRAALLRWSLRILYHSTPPSPSRGSREGSMLPQMNILLEIQELDKERLTLNEQLRAYPILWDEIKKRHTQRKHEFDKATTANKEFTSSRNRLEQEIKVGRDLLKRYEGQVSLMRTQREVAALSTQIDQTKQRLSKFEEEHTRLMQREAQLREDEEKAKVAHEEVQREAKEERDRIKTQMRSKKERLADIEATRKKLLSKADKKMLVAYERLLQQWPGSAIVPARNGSCTGCHFAILPQKMVEIHREQSLAYCDNCRRIICEDEDYKPEVAEAKSAE